ncbi:MFS transporter [Promicromonospora thailandica]|uniref:MFS transporter, DHA1 family, arabinose polymer transporter n=1 Tax=Promicromonospora thailandica TaxID=765201 RepID=A0A9X2GD60_9MICO|nr:MFS transporter [Promicromonospora thailandica]MCP2266391.1 MFS transporter, DHA1 family, arabinose polymer transporter [Promicromonospora thailandica]
MTRPTTARLPFVVWLLTLGTFLMGTSEYIVAGILPQLSADLGVGIAQGGLLITVFAAGLIVGPPILSIVTLRLPRRSALVLALVVFALGHALAAASSSFAVVLGARVVTALATGTFWAVAGAVAVSAVPPTARARASAMIISGVGLATVLGVPLGALVGGQVGWRGAFWGLAALAGLTALVIGRFVPAAPRDGATADVRSEISALRVGRLWLTLATSTLLFGGVLAAYSYVVPLLTDRAGVPVGAISLVLVGYGIGALAGTWVGGRLGDARPLATQAGAIAVAGLALVLLQTPLSTSGVAAVALLVLMGVAGQSVPPVSTALAVRFAPGAPTLAYALATSALNVGIAGGSLVGGLALDSTLGLTGPALVGTVMIAAALVPLLALAARRATRDDVG